MYHNGVSHKAERHDMEGIQRILKWLSFMPAYKGCPLPILEPVDPIEREIAFAPTRAPYDSRWLFTGRQNPREF